MQSSHTLDRLDVAFNDPTLVANAGLLLPATLAQHLGLADLFHDKVDLGTAPGRANVGLKSMTMIASLLAGGSCIDHANVLRSGSSARVLGHAVAAPSTMGTFLRSFTWGHSKQLDVVSEIALKRAWAAGAGPGQKPLTIDLDSTICETYGLQKQGGSRFTYTRVRGYHPLLATAAGMGDVLHSRLRGGPANSGRGSASFVNETFLRVRRAGAGGPLVLRADSGFYNRMVVRACGRRGARFSITVRLSKQLHKIISEIPDDAWTSIPYWLEGTADVAETPYQAFASTPQRKDVRLIVRRVQPTPGSQLQLQGVLFTYHAFITDREGHTLDLELDHRQHAVVENTIRDLKEGVGLNHMPSGRFAANAAWLAFAVMAHNLARWVSRIGLGDALVNTNSLRRQFFAVPGRLVRSARRQCLRLPEHWPWQQHFIDALERLRDLSAPVSA
ncbi:MAG: IS1380 family transposase [Candidatus Dormibacteria bacterium]